VIRATINGHSHEFVEGVSILNAAKSSGIDIPTLCHDSRLKPIGSCRMCLVQIEGHSHPLASCNTALTEGMSIFTHAPALEHERQITAIEAGLGLTEIAQFTAPPPPKG